MKKNLRFVNEVEISKSKRIIAALMLFSYVSVLNPFVVFANTAKQEITECKEVLISAQDGGKIELDGASIEIPSGALKKDTKISITHLRRVEDTGESLYNAIPSSGGYRFLPHGTKFLKDVTITLPYSPELNGKPQALEDLFTYFYDEKNHQWIKLERLEVNQKECVVRSLSSHFTDMINATLTLPESASPVDVNLNSIKNLEAAKPDGHLIKFNSPKASNMGDASFSFELAVPAGRRGMEPAISVSYSSAGGNGIMGKGFDVSYGSSVTIDTRLGLPEYDSREYTGSTEEIRLGLQKIKIKPVKYMLDGILLYEKIEARTESYASYMQQKEGAFSRIEHFFGDKNYWLVTDKSGTKRYYGQTEASCVGSGNETYTWNLTKEIDVNGNTVDYKYINDSGYSYPDTIQYTGYEGSKKDAESGSYSVVFNYDKKPEDAKADDSWPRADVRIDARSKKIVACKKILTSITTHYNSQNPPIRTYTFKYNEGLAKEKMLTALSVKNNAGESYEYGFEYNPVKDFFADPVPWNTRDQKLQAGVSTNIGANFNATAGAGFGFPVADVRATGGANGSISEGESYTEDTLVDINGDGKPDAIKQTDNGIQVALNTGSGFDTFKSLTIDGNYLNVDLDYEKTRSSAVGWNVYTGVGLAVPVVNPTLGLGYSQVLQKTTSETEVSFTDMDRDGRVDIIETGKNYYLKNLGGCEFKKVPLKSNAYIPSLSPKFTNKEKNDYYETYYGQTPFRVWKSPYEGILSIHETVSPVTGTYNSKKNIIAKTFIGSEDNCDKELKMSFTGNSVSSYKNDFTIDKDTNVYFITNNGSDPSQSDIEWNVEINYSKAKVLKRNYKNPVHYILDSYICDAVTYNENISDFSEEIQNQVIERCSEKFIKEKNLPDESLMGLYNINCKYNSDTYNRNIKVTISFDQQRAQKANYNENIRRLLIENGNFLPVYFTNEEFEKYVEELKENPNINDELLKEFSACFLHHVTEGIFELIIDFEKTEDISKFYGTYPLSLELKLQSLKKYEAFGTGSTFTKDEVIYKDSKQISFENDLERNSEENNGTVFEVEENKYVNIGFLGKENEKQPILLNLTDKKLEQGGNILSNLIVDSVNIDDYNKKADVYLTYNPDENKTPESKITISLKNLSYRANNLTKKEFKKIFDDIEVPYTDIHDAYWNWDIEREVKEENLNVELFLNIPLSEKAQDDLISFMYDKKEKTKNSNNVETEDHDYYYYCLKENPDFEKAQKILDEYKYEIVMNEKFPFYEEDSQKEYVIKEFWRNEKTEDEINEYIADDDSYKIVTNYEEYQELNDTLIEECKKFNIGKYVNIDCEIVYDKEHLYSIINGENPLQDSFVQMLKMNKSEDNEISFAIEKTSIGKACWNSKKDYSNKNKASLYEISSYTEKINSVSTEFPEEYQNTLGELANDEINAGNTVHVRVNDDEFLYGGVNNWFYGIWKNIWYYEDENVTELTEKNPFSEEALLKCLYNDDTSQIQSKELLQEKMKSSGEDVKRDEEGNVVKQENIVYYYLPEVKKENKNYSSIINLRNKDINYDVDYENSLLGLVVTETTYENTANGKVPVNSYYMPFIFEDIIHSDRAGGQIFYNVDGLFSNKISDNESSSGLSDFKMPVIRKTFTDGDENTPSVSAGLGPISINFADVFSNKSLEEKFTSFSVGGASVSKNISNSESMQCFQDITGDGIPDILQAAGTKLNVIKGTLNNNEVTFENTNGFSAETFISNLSKNKTDTTIAGASVSSTGNIKTTPKVNSYGQIKTVEVVTLPSSSGSGSLTYSISDSKQSSGLSDINGDGLPDYYTGSYYLLNNGNGFEHVNNTFAEKLYLSESINKSIALNVSVMLGADLYKAASIFPGPSVNVGASYSFSSSNVTKMMTDINGDGLSDILEINPDSNGSGSTEIKVKFNTGNGYTGSIKIKLPEWKDINILDFINQENDATFDLGILDDVDVFKKAKNKLNLTQITKNPFGFGASNFVNSLEWSSSVTLGLNGGIGGNFDYGINIIIPAPPFYIGTVHITGAGGAGANASTTINGTSVKLMDLDGDGLPDHVLKIPNGSIWWKRNLSGKIGLLNKISLPQGGNIQIDYAEQYGTVDNPNFKYVMSKVTVNDGCGEVVPKIDHEKHCVVTEYEYSDGYYDRKKKDFYGYGKITTKFADGSKQLDEYNNSDYYLKGTISSSSLFDENGNTLSENSTKYCDEPFGLPAIENSKQYEAASEDAFIETRTSYTYDEYGNCTSIEQDFGNGEKLYAEIEYENRDSSDKYLIGLPVDISVYGTDDTLLRHRSGTYNDEGQLTSLKQYFTSNDYSENTITYDVYGNITSVKDSRDATLAYEYDSDVHMFVNTIRQKGSGTEEYVSEIETEVSTQTKQSETDCNGNKIEYRYDKWQRLEKVWDSYSSEANPTVTYSYNTPCNNSDGSHNLWYTITNNKVTFDVDDTRVIQTVLQIDGLGRTARTAKTGFVNGMPGWNASGAVFYDEKGRAVTEGMTEFIEGSLQDLLNTLPEMTNLKTEYAYDAKDRKIKTKLPDDAIQTTSFKVENNNLITETTDPNGNIAVQESDSRGNIVRVARKDKDEKLLTEVTYKYNEMGEMLKAFDAKGHPISAEYDLLGRRTALESLDSGRQEFFYDAASNLIRERNSALSARGKQINYEYDGLNRLVKIDYPNTMDTLYTYGRPSDKNIGAAGKILKIEDASGTLEYEYGKLGEVKKEKRTLATHLHGRYPTVTAEMKYCSDYLGRMQSITYPDGEELTYGYDAGGQVVSVTGNHWGTEFKYVTNILYDEYGQRTRIDYGNGTHTDYTYDPARRWLRTIKTQNKGGIQFQNMSYEFDPVGNVNGYKNDCLDSAHGNYKTCQNYEYDGLYQLTRATGETIYNPYKSPVPEYTSSYEQKFEFDSDGLGNMMKKTSSEKVSPKRTIGDNLNYTFNYEYDPAYAHRLKSVGNMYYLYDDNGNVICEQDGSFESNGDDVNYRKISEEAEGVYSSDYGWGLWREEVGGKSNGRYRRTYSWNERNQLVCSQDSRYTTNYIYGQDGQRTNKYTARSETLYFNKMWTLHTDSGNSVYGGQNAKNIYLGDTRIVTKLAGPNETTTHEEWYKQYYYHSDHLGSASLISDYKGDEYQRIEYTPYGETWVEKTENTGLAYLPYKFTGKEMDEETGLYYYGARYLDPKYSRWISTDPAVGEYLSKTSEGEGGIYNSVNLNLYHYAGNSPITLVDPDGREVLYFVFRNRKSYDISTDRASPKNYYLDKAVVFDTNTFKIEYFDKVQTVANYPSTDVFGNEVASCYNDTIAPGRFDEKVYTTTNVAAGDAAVLCNAKTIDGRKVNENGITESPLSTGRGLEHSNTNPNTKKEFNSSPQNPEGVPYSKQCIIKPGKDSARYFKFLRDAGLKNGDIVKGFLFEFGKKNGKVE